MAYKETDPQTASMFAINSLAICKTMTAPYERFKLILQTQSMSKINVNYQNMKVSDYFKTAKSREGSRSFFRGNLTNILHSIPSIYLRIQLYLHLRSKFQNNENLTKSQFIFCELLISGVSATIPLLAFYPLEVIKIRLTTEIRLKKNEKIYAGIYDCFHKIYTAEGIRGLYRGLGISCIGAVSYLTMVTLTNNWFSNYFYKTRNRAFSDSSELYRIENYGFKFIEFFGAGAVSVGLTQLILYPLDTIRRRMQVSGAQGYQCGYNSYKQCFIDLWNMEGARGFYRGCQVSLYKNMVVTILYFTFFVWFYEYKKQTN